VPGAKLREHPPHRGWGLRGAGGGRMVAPPPTFDSSSWGIVLLKPKPDGNARGESLVRTALVSRQRVAVAALLRCANSQGYMTATARYSASRPGQGPGRAFA
jgi:hypothetical protein